MLGDVPNSDVGRGAVSIVEEESDLNVWAWSLKGATMFREPHGLDDDVVHMHLSCRPGRAWGIRHHATVETDGAKNGVDGVGGGDDVPAALHRVAVRNRQGGRHLSAVGSQREGAGQGIVRTHARADCSDVSPRNGSGVSHPASRGEGARYGQYRQRDRHHGETHPKSRSRHPYPRYGPRPRQAGTANRDATTVQNHRESLAACDWTVISAKAAIDGSEIRSFPSVRRS